MKKHSAKAGLPPGILVHVGEKLVDKTTITIIDYDEAGVTESAVETPGECREYVGRNTVTWVNLVGLHDTDLVQRFGDVFEIHPLVLEEILNTGQRPKIDDHGDYIFFVGKMLYRSPGNGHIVAEQVSLVLGHNYVLSFQELKEDVFDPIRERIRTATGRIRGMGGSYLAYALLDAVVDNYYVVIEEVTERIEELQEQVVADPAPAALEAINRLKSDLVFMRKALWPLREVVGSLERSESALVERDVAPYLRDVYEHTIQVIDSVESLRDLLSGVLDIYMSSISNRMNEVMRVLTVIATIFIPLTFIAGVYGMNFERMPELQWPFGYAAVLGVMLLVSLGMVAYFRKRHWL